MRTQGKLVKWNNDKGFGFIKPSTGGKEVFIHISELRNRTRRPKLNELISYTSAQDNRNRPRAIKATFATDKKKNQNTSSPVVFPVILSTVFFVIVGVMVFAGKMPLIVLILYLVLSLLAFVMYAKDKSAAHNGTWRTSEATLHMISLAGGWPGALIAQQKLRHKSKKQSFRFVFWITVALNFTLFMWLLTPNGSIMFHTLVTNYSH
jgi:uncharacterized membrane protein YsdA (DUF1294 family)/cold shock CspA family protein